MVRLRGWLAARYRLAYRCAAFVLLAVIGDAFAVEIIAHRGASHDAPENTLPAVRLAWDRDADAVEIDIFQSSDGRIVAIHDADTERVAGRAGRVADQTLARLQLLDVGAWKGERWRGTRIPTLEAVLGTVPPGKTLVIEIKCSSAVIPDLERVLDASGKRDRAMLIAFDYDTISEVKRIMPDRAAYWLYHFAPDEAERYAVREPQDLVRRVVQAGLDGLDVRHDGPWVAELAGSLGAIGKDLYVYTVNDPDQARWLRTIGVKGITTDRPGYLRTALEAE